MSILIQSLATDETISFSPLESINCLRIENWYTEEISVDSHHTNRNNTTKQVVKYIENIYDPSIYFQADVTKLHCHL